MLDSVSEHAAKRARVISEVQGYLIHLGCPCAVIYCDDRSVSDPGGQGDDSRKVVGYVYGDPKLVLSNRLYIFTVEGGLLACDVPHASLGQQAREYVLNKVRNLFISGEVQYWRTPGKSFEQFLKDYFLLNALPQSLGDPDKDVEEIDKLVAGLQQESERRKALQEKAEDAVLGRLRGAVNRKEDPKGGDEPPKSQ